MYKNVLESIANVDVYPIVSLVLFMLVFTAMLVWTLRKDKNYLDEMAQKPLEDAQDHVDASAAHS